MSRLLKISAVEAAKTGGARAYTYRDMHQNSPSPSMMPPVSVAAARDNSTSMFESEETDLSGREEESTMTAVLQYSTSTGDHRQLPLSPPKSPWPSGVRMTRNHRHRYRVVFGVDASDAMRAVPEVLRTWIQTSCSGTSTRCAILREDTTDGAHVLRHSIVQEIGNSLWTVELTVYRPALDDEGLLWLDVDAPEESRPALAQLISGLIAATGVRDGAHLMTSAPESATTSDLEHLTSRLLDPHRRGLLFLAGSATAAGIPEQQWSECVSAILADTSGVAAAYILDGAATEQFNATMPAELRIRPYTIRTFEPGVCLDDPAQGDRHPTLSTQSIVHDDQTYLRRLLGRRAREVANRADLPEDLRAIDTRLGEEIQLILPVSPRSCTTPSTPSAAAQAAHQILPGLLAEVLGDSTVTVTAVREICATALQARSALASNHEAQQRIKTLQTQLFTEKADTAALRSCLEEEKAETSALVQELSETERQLRHAQNLLVAMGHKDCTDAVLAELPADVMPRSFDELLRRLNELSSIEFTGDPAKALELDARNSDGAWAEQCWKALLALNDYAELSRAGRFEGHIESYLMATPFGQHGFSARRHARIETAEVANTAKYRRPRMLPVPKEVDPTGKAYMEAHFKISQSGTVSPRMHYLDDTARTGRIYVGYIGRHLPTSRTN